MTQSKQVERRCALCGKPAAETYRPFCSRRCADIDLQRWFAGSYAVPAQEADGETAESEADPGV